MNIHFHQAAHLLQFLMFEEYSIIFPANWQDIGDTVTVFGHVIGITARSSVK
jgi:hypothetical protein